MTPDGGSVLTMQFTMSSFVEVHRFPSLRLSKETSFRLLDVGVIGSRSDGCNS